MNYIKLDGTCVKFKQTNIVKKSILYGVKDAAAPAVNIILQTIWNKAGCLCLEARRVRHILDYPGYTVMFDLTFQFGHGTRLDSGDAVNRLLSEIEEDLKNFPWLERIGHTHNYQEEQEMD